jgi:chemotaxis protein CheC
MSRSHDDHDSGKRVPSGGDLVIPVRKLRVINRLGSVGVDGVEHRLQWFSHYNDTVQSDLVETGFVDTASLEGEFGDREFVGGRVELPDVPYGYAVVLFSTHSANNAAALMLSNTVDDVSTVSEEMARSAVTELSSIIVNGFFDGWADAFDEEIHLAEPTPVHNTEQEVVESTVGDIDAYGIYLSSRIRLPRHGVTARFHLFPDTETFVELVERIDPGLVE